MGGLAPIDVEDIAKIAGQGDERQRTRGKSFAMTGPEALTMSAIADRISIAISSPVLLHLRSAAKDRRDCVGARWRYADLSGGRTYERALERPTEIQKAQVSPWIRTSNSACEASHHLRRVAHQNAARFRGERCYWPA